MNNTHKYSEIFFSFQGEGSYVGRPTAWMRFFNCNLQCDGFSQENPMDPSTYILPYQTIDLTDITDIKELPVFEYGCDSSMSWSKRYKHLALDKTAIEIVADIEDSFKHVSNPNGMFRHPATNQETHMAFTGGEPMLKAAQTGMIDVMHAFQAKNNMPRFVTVETNGSRKISPELKDMINKFYTSEEFGGMVPDERGRTEWFWSISPKLFSTSGEKPKKAIRPEFVKEYAEVSKYGQLKYVVNGTQQSWDEVEEHTAAFRENQVYFPVYIMPVGATKEQQEEEQIAEIAVEAMKRGYNFAGRLHCSVFGNKIGT